MKIKLKYKIFALFVGLGVTYIVYMNSYTEFIPIVFQNDSYEYSEIRNGSFFHINLKKVLEYYDIQYKVSENGNILVKRKIIQDKELMLNYSKKATDTIWINSHRVQMVQPN